MAHPPCTYLFINLSYDESAQPRSIGEALEEAILKYGELPTTDLSRYWGHQHLMNVLGSTLLGEVVYNNKVTKNNRRSAILGGTRQVEQYSD